MTDVKFEKMTLKQLSESKWWPEVVKLRLKGSSKFSDFYRWPKDVSDLETTIVLVDDQPIAISIFDSEENKIGLFVSENYRRMGIGKMLLERTIDAATTVFPHDEPSRAFFDIVVPNAPRRRYW